MKRNSHHYVVLLALFFLAGSLAMPLQAQEPEAPAKPGPMDMFRAYSRMQLAAGGFTRHESGTDGSKLVWWEAGEGPALVMIHGVADQAGTWFAVAPKLATSHHVFLVDLPGHGESGPSSGPLPMTTVLGGLESWLSAQVIAEGQEPPVLGGNSMGAWLALLVAHRHSAWVSRVVAVNGGPLHFVPPDGLNLMPKTRDEARAVMATLRDPSSPVTPDLVLDDLVRRVPGGEVARMFEANDDLESYLLADATLVEIKTPVDLVWGASDRYLGAEYPQRLVSGLPNARLTLLETCGHLPQAECPVPFLEALTTVLAHD